MQVIFDTQREIAIPSSIGQTFRVAKKPDTPSRVSQTRYANFLILLKEFGQKEPGVGLIRRFAEFVDVEQNYISQVKTKRKNIGDAFALQLQRAFKKPHGWMDQEHPWWEPRDTGEKLFLQVSIQLYRDTEPEFQATVVTELRELLERFKRR